MKPMALLARHAMALAAFSTLTALSSAAHAVVTYTYTGPALNYFFNDVPEHPVSASGVVASFVFDEPLGADVGTTDNHSLVVPVSWSIAGGGYSLASNDFGATLFAGGIFIFTDSSGAVRGWDVSAYVSDGVNNVGPQFRSLSYPTGQFSTTGQAIRNDYVLYVTSGGFSGAQNNTLGEGSWTVSAVPEPGTLALMLAGVAAVGGLARRRCRAN